MSGSNRPRSLSDSTGAPSIARSSSSSILMDEASERELLIPRKKSKSRQNGNALQAPTVTLDNRSQDIVNPRHFVPQIAPMSPERQALRDAFLESVEINNYNPVDGTINGRPIANVAYAQDYIEDINVQTASFFFGPFTNFREDSYEVVQVPVSLQKKDNSAESDSSSEETSESESEMKTVAVTKRRALWRLILENIYWKPEKTSSVGWYIAWAIFLPLIIPVRTAYALYSLVATPLRNLFKLALETLPLYLKKLIDIGIQKVDAESDKFKDAWEIRLQGQGLQFIISNRAQRFAWLLVGGLLDIARGIVTVWHAIGRQIMSPKKSADIFAKNKVLGSELVSRIFSYVLSAVLILIATALFKTFAVQPLKIFLQDILPVAAAKFAGWCMDGIEHARLYFADHAPWVNDAFEAVGKFFSDTIPTFFKDNTPEWFIDAMKATGDWFANTYATAVDFVKPYIQSVYNSVYDAVMPFFRKLSERILMAASFMKEAYLNTPENVAEGAEILATTAAVGAVYAAGTAATTVYESVGDGLNARYGHSAPQQVLPAVALASAPLIMNDGSANDLGIIYSETRNDKINSIVEQKIAQTGVGSSLDNSSQGAPVAKSQPIAINANHGSVSSSSSPLASSHSDATDSHGESVSASASAGGRFRARSAPASRALRPGLFDAPVPTSSPVVNKEQANPLKKSGGQ